MSSYKSEPLDEASEYYRDKMVNTVRNCQMPLTPWELNERHSKFQGEAIRRFRSNLVGKSTSTAIVERNISKLYHGFENMNRENRRQIMIEAVLGRKNYVKSIH